MLPTSDGQAMVTEDGGAVRAVLWDFEQPEKKLSNRPFYTKVLPGHTAAPVQLRVAHLSPEAAYTVQIHRTGYHANDTYTAYLEMGSPKELIVAQVEQLNELTRDLPETNRLVHASRMEHWRCRSHAQQRRGLTYG